MAVSAAITACPHCGREHDETVLRCPDTDLVLPLPGRLLDGKFRLESQLGRGGMATVWLARHTLVDRHVAIKIIRPEVVRNEQIIARFRGEAKAAGRIAHRNVCEILDFGLGPLGPYIVMERLEGQNLGQVLARWVQLSPSQMAAILKPALEGLIAAHRKGIIHRDLKPENVFLHRNNEGKTVVKLMDFGVAKFTDGTGEIETEQGALLGTPQYMAPEQFKGADLADERTDVWGIGTILYRALSGRDAFRGPTVAATLMKVTHEDPESILATRSDLSDELDAVVMRCLQKDPSDRFSTVDALLEALTEAVPETCDLDAFAWDEEPPSVPDPEPALPGPALARPGRNDFPPPGLDEPAPFPPLSTAEPPLPSPAERPTVRGYGPLNPASGDSAAPTRPRAPVAPDRATASSTPTRPRAPVAPDRTPGSSVPDASVSMAELEPISRATTRTAPRVKASSSRWKARAVVALGLGAAVLGTLTWRAQSRPGTTDPSSAAPLPSPPPTSSATPALPTPGSTPNPMAGLPAPPPADQRPEFDIDDLFGGGESTSTAPDTVDLDAVPPMDADGTEGTPPAQDDQLPPPPPGSATEGGQADPVTDGLAGDSLSGQDADPFGLAHADEWVAPVELGPITDHNAARRYCESLDQAKYAGLSGWHLANPGVATRLANSGALPNGRYWTSARWKNKVIVIAVPKARQSSRNADTRIAHPLCAAKVGPSPE